MKHLTKTIFAFSLFFPIASILAAGAPVALMGPAPQPSKEQEIVKITLHPMPETRPALKYQLLPPFLERRPGNAAVPWSQLPADRTGFLMEFGKPGGTREKIEKWMEIPIGDPREKEFRSKEPAINALLKATSIFADMAYAARFESCDWELPIREGHFFEVLLPELNQSHTWERMLAAKAHGEIADKKYAEAVRTFQTGFAFARHHAQGQTLIHGVVGTELATFMTNQIEQFISQPDAPSLYWSLDVLPRPLIDYRPGFELEMNSLALAFPDLQGLEQKKLSKEQWNELLGGSLHKLERVRELTGTGGTTRMAAVLSIAQGYPHAKRYLIDHGRTKAEVEAMPPSQVVLLYSVSLFEELRDDFFKAVFLPYPEAKAVLERFDTRLREDSKREVLPFASALLPAMRNAKDAETRMPWIIARLRIFEALRIYAAAHNGQLPERLGDIREVPIPVNPFDDKPFTYHRDGNRAMLGCESGPRNRPWRYEITMAPNTKSPSP